jgi:hypothetical protein
MWQARAATDQRLNGKRPPLAQHQEPAVRSTGWVEENIGGTLTFYRLPRQHHKHHQHARAAERGATPAHAHGADLSHERNRRAQRAMPNRNDRPLELRDAAKREQPTSTAYTPETEQ